MSDEYDVKYVVGALVAGVFFGGLGGGVAFPTLPTLGEFLGITPFVVGLILAINRATRLVMNTPAGQILDRVGTRRPMIGGFLVQALAPFGYVLGMHAREFGLDPASVFLASRALWGVGSAFVFVGAFSTVTHVTTPENRGTWTGYMRGGQSLGFPAGLVVGGLVADAYSYSAAFLVAGAAGLFAAFVAFLVLPDVDPDLGESGSLRELPALVRADDRILAVGTVNFVGRFLFVGVLLSTVVTYAAENSIHIGVLSETGVSGVVMAVGVLASSASTLLVGRVSDRVSNRALVSVPALCVLASGFVVLAVLPTLTGAVVGVALIGVGVSGANLPLLAYLGDISPADDVGKLGGVYNVFGDFGSTLGPLVALPVAATVGYGAEYVACAALAALAAVLVVVVLLGDDDTVSADAVGAE